MEQTHPNKQHVKGVSDVPNFYRDKTVSDGLNTDTYQ